MKITNTQQQIIMGSLLGDGCLAPRKNRKNTRFSIMRKLEDKMYLEWQFSFLKNLCLTGIRTKSYFDSRTNKTYYSCYFNTISSDELTNISKQWYNNGIKRIPPKLKLTPLVLGIWFLDDGNIRTTSSENAIQITLSTNGFSYNEIVELSNKLTRKFGGYFGVYKNKNKYVISFTTKPAIKFLKCISKSIPLDVMIRKTDYIRQYV